MEDVRDVIDSLEQGIEHLRNACSDAKCIQGIDGIVLYEELDRLVTIAQMALERVNKLKRP